MIRGQLRFVCCCVLTLCLLSSASSKPSEPPLLQHALIELHVSEYLNEDHYARYHVLNADSKAIVVYKPAVVWTLGNNEPVVPDLAFSIDHNNLNPRPDNWFSPGPIAKPAALQPTDLANLGQLVESGRLRDYPNYRFLSYEDVGITRPIPDPTNDPNRDILLADGTQNIVYLEENGWLVPVRRGPERRSTVAVGQNAYYVDLSGAAGHGGGLSWSESIKILPNDAEEIVFLVKAEDLWIPLTIYPILYVVIDSKKVVFELEPFTLPRLQTRPRPVPPPPPVSTSPRP